VIFITVGTPSKEDGSADLGAVFHAAESIGRAANGYAPRVLAMKSTVPVGTGDEIQVLMAQLGAHNVSVVSNPEFLREGHAIRDFLQPNRVVIGAQDSYGKGILHELYSAFVPEDRILLMDRHSAEMAKYVSNAFLATRISFINEIAALCESVNADVEAVRRAVGMDPRIGRTYLAPGVGYGGSCLPKDVRALIHAGQVRDLPMELTEAVHRVNTQQPLRFLRKVQDHFREGLRGRKVTVWGLAFKPGTDDVRDSPSIVLIRLLLEGEADVTVYDPRANEAAEFVLPEGVTFSSDRYESLRDAEALIVVTEWDEFRAPDFARMRVLMISPVIFDGRNIYDPDTVRRHGFSYHGVGRPSPLQEVPLASTTTYSSRVAR